jgi:hypothetical protein
VEQVALNRHVSSIRFALVPLQSLGVLLGAIALSLLCLRMKELSSGNSGGAGERKDAEMKINDNRFGRWSVKQMGGSEPG